MKIIGTIFLIFAGLAAGFCFREKYTSKIKFLNQYVSLITLIKNQICYSATPLRVIIQNSNVSYPLKSYVDNYLKFAEKFSPAVSWQKSFEKTRTDFMLSQEEKNLIVIFGRQLGTSDCITQSESCVQHIELIKPYIKIAIEEKNSKGKLPLVLGASAGFAIAILII